MAEPEVQPRFAQLYNLCSLKFFSGKLEKSDSDWPVAGFRGSHEDLSPRFVYHLSLSNTFLCVGFILMWVSICGVKEIQVWFTVLSRKYISFLIIIAKDSGLILIVRTMEHHDWLGLDHMHIPWSCGGLVTCT